MWTRGVTDGNEKVAVGLGDALLNMGSAAQRWIGWCHVCVLEIFETHERGREEVRIGAVMVVSFVLSRPCPYCAVRLNPLQRYLESICCVGAILALSWSDAAVMMPNSL
jgi:hypothetical protein